MSTNSQTLKKPGAKNTSNVHCKVIRIVKSKGRSRLELRNKLGMPREVFGRLVNVSVRTIAEVESNQKAPEKLLRNYIEVKRLCDSLMEVVEPASLGEWMGTPNVALDGFKPLEVIERGEIDRLWKISYQLRSGMPG